MTEKTHYRKAFDSPYLSSADIVQPTVLTVRQVLLEADRTKKTRDVFNTAHFAETEIRPGEKLKPMILNATNSKTMRALTGSPFIEDWRDVRVTIYVEQDVKFGKESVEGLRISTEPPAAITAEDQEELDKLRAASLEGVQALRQAFSVSTISDALWTRERPSLDKAAKAADRGVKR